jgi:hypothetical protein
MGLLPQISPISPGAHYRQGFRPVAVFDHGYYGTSEINGVGQAAGRYVFTTTLAASKHGGGKAAHGKHPAHRRRPLDEIAPRQGQAGLFDHVDKQGWRTATAALMIVTMPLFMFF